MCISTMHRGKRANLNFLLAPSNSNSLVINPKTDKINIKCRQDHRTPTATYIKLRNAILQATKNYTQYGTQNYYNKKTSLLQTSESHRLINTLNNTDKRPTDLAFALNAAAWLRALYTNPPSGLLLDISAQNLTYIVIRRIFRFSNCTCGRSNRH